MPQFTFPKDKEWTTDYSNPFTGTLKFTHNVSFNGAPGFITLSPRLMPHSVTGSVTNITAATDFEYSNATGGNLYWAVGTKLWNTNGLYSNLFAADSISGSPTSLSDADLIKFGKGTGGYDHLFVSGGKKVARLNSDSPSTWDNDWWYGATAGQALEGNVNTTLNGTQALSSGTLNVVSTTGFPTSGGFIVKNANSVFEYISYTGVTATSFTGCTGGSGANGNSGTAVVTVLTNITLDANYPTILHKFQDILLVCNKNYVHSVLDNKNGTYTTTHRRLVFQNDQAISSVTSTKEKVLMVLNNTDSISDAMVAEYDIFNEQIRAQIIPSIGATAFVYMNSFYIIDRNGVIARYNGYSFDEISHFPTKDLTGYTINPVHRNGIFAKKQKIYIAVTPSPRVEGGIWELDIEKKRLTRYLSLSTARTTNADYGIVTDGTGTTTLYGMYCFDGSSGFLLGANARDNTGSTMSGIWSTANISPMYTSNDRAYFTTSRIGGPEGCDTRWRNVCIKFNPWSDTDGTRSGTIIVKCRVQERKNQSVAYASTWTTTSAFTTTNPLTNVVVGDEVMILNGEGAGYCAHIVSITGTSTKTVTIDETLPITTGKDFVADYKNWVKLAPSITITTNDYYDLDIPEDMVGDWIEFKVEMRGSFTFEEFLIGYQSNLVVEK